MLLLTATTDKFQLVTDVACDVDVHASWVDNATGTISLGRTNTTITTATTTDIVAAPGASTVRNVKTFNIRNTITTAVTVTILFNQNATLFELFKAQLAGGEALQYVEGLGWNIYTADGSHKMPSGSVLFKCLAADATGQNIATVQPWFPSAGAVAVAANTTYFFEGILELTTGATTKTIALSMGGSATLTSIGYWAITSAASAAGTLQATQSSIYINSAAAAIINATNTNAETRIVVAGTVRINAAGTFIPQYTFSANPTGTILTKANSYFRMWPVGDGSVGSQGTWS